MPMDRATYPPDWELRSRFVRFVRGRGRCEWCGAQHGKPHPVTGSIVILTTAHVYDMAHTACSLLNLAALCQKCHLNHDRGIHHANAWQTRRTKMNNGELFPLEASFIWKPTGQVIHFKRSS